MIIQGHSNLQQPGATLQDQAHWYQVSPYHLIWEHVINEAVVLQFVSTEQIADIFTKPLDESTFSRLVGELGMLNLN